MSRNSVPAVGLSLVLAAGILAQEVARDGPPISPFRGLRVVDTGIEVQVEDDTWQALVTVHGVDAATLIRESKRLCGDRWLKRITEDLPALLDAMGHPAGTAVDLQLRDLDSGKLIERKDVEMTRSNRARLAAANRAATGAGSPGIEPPPAEVTADQVRADLAELQRLLDTRFAYRELRKVDLDGLLAGARKRLAGPRIATDVLAREVDAILRAFGDGHSRLLAPPAPPASGFLPFLVQRAQGGHVAFLPDRTALVEPEHPFVTAIDGAPLERWLAAARELATIGSPALVELESERGLRDLGVLRAALGRPAGTAVSVQLRGSKGHRTVELEVARRRPTFGEWPRTSSRVLDGNVGCLRLASMADTPSLLDSIDADMASFRDTRGLVIDVRGNGGGKRDALLRVFPYLLGKDDPPQVVNAAAALLATIANGTPSDALLADRHLYLADWSGWDEPARSSITQFARSFRPEWRLPAGRFSAWHFMVLARGDNPKAYHYDKPVVVLIDSGCFSATDVFVAALRTRPQVRLVGTETSGGSGRAITYTLGHSRLGLQLSSMASFRPDGRLFEGRGVEPDVRVEPAPLDLVGQGDAVLAKALELLRQ